MTLYSLCFYGRSFVRFQNKLFLLCCVSGAGREEPAPQEEAAVSHQDVQQQAAWEVCRARLHLGHSYVPNTHWNITEHHAEDPPHKNCDILCPKGWLDDIGLPQYKDQFNDGRVDGQMLQYLTVVSVSITAEQDAGLKLVMYVVTFSENTWIWGACFTSLGFRLTSQKIKFSAHFLSPRHSCTHRSDSSPPQNDLLFLKVTSQLHHLSIKCAIHVLHVNKFHPNCLRRRPGNEVSVCVHVRLYCSFSFWSSILLVFSFNWECFKASSRNIDFFADSACPFGLKMAMENKVNFFCVPYHQTTDFSLARRPFHSSLTHKKNWNPIQWQASGLTVTIS